MLIKERSSSQTLGNISVAHYGTWARPKVPKLLKEATFKR